MIETSRVLVVDDDPDVLATIGDQLAARGYDVRCVADPEAAVPYLTPTLTDIAVLDVGARGLRLAREAASRNIPFVLISGRPVIIEMGGLGEVLRKPFRGEELIARIERRLRDLSETPSRPIGASRPEDIPPSLAVPP